MNYTPCRTCTLGIQRYIAVVGEVSISLSGSGEETCTHWNDMVANFHVGDTLTDALDDTTTFVTEDDGESTFWILAC
jgi:hypothetical protein